MYDEASYLAPERPRRTWLPPIPQAPRPLPAATPAAWGFGDVLWVILAVLGCIGVGIGLGMLGSAVFNPQKNASLDLFITTTIGTGVYIAAWVAMLVVARLRGRALRDFGLRKPSLVWLLGGVGLGIIFIPIRVTLIVLIVLIFNLGGDTPSEDPALDYPLLLIFALLEAGFMVAVLAPIVEEFFFRGVLHNWFRGRLPALVAIVLSGVLFGLAHLDPLSAISNIIMGLVLSTAYEYSRSLWVPMLIHFVNNFLVLVFVVLLAILLG